MHGENLKLKRNTICYFVSGITKIIGEEKEEYSRFSSMHIIERSYTEDIWFSLKLFA